jgi:glycosyltransferase involved in cell wall biosynthesis
VFSQRLDNFIAQQKIGGLVELTGYVSDEQLALLYQNAQAFVFPTLSEGFGLPGLEAMSLGCPVLCSDIPVLKEIYGQAAEYFDPSKPKDIAQKIVDFEKNNNRKKELIEKGYALLKKYSWQKMASETLKVYDKV